MKIVKSQINMDLSVTAVEWACEDLRVQPKGEIVIHSDGDRDAARKIAEVLGCVTVEVPKEILVKPSAWAVTTSGGMFWSEGLS